MISSSQSVLLEALKATLFEVEPSYPNETDWNEVVAEAKSQTVLGLVCPVIPVDDELCDQGKASYLRMLYEQDKLVSLLDSYGIPFVVLKGFAAAVYYPKPFLRAMGDVDILVSKDRILESMNILESNGYKYMYGKDSDGHLIVGERNIVYIKNEIVFELHYRFSSDGYDIDDYLENAMSRRVYRNLSGFRFPMLPDVENGLVLLGHINQHLKENQLGLRQIIDWEMYVHSVLHESSWQDSFIVLANKVGLLELAISITMLCKEHLGLPDTVKMCSDMKCDLSDDLLEILFTDGNFGRKGMTSSVKEKRRIRRMVYSLKTDGFFHLALRVGMSRLEQSKKHPILRPIALVYGIIVIITKGISTCYRNRDVSKQVKEGKKRYEIYKTIGVKSGKNRRNVND